VTSGLPALLEFLAAAAVLQAAPQPGPQAVPPADRLAALAEAAPPEELVSETRLHPEAARQAFQDLLRGSPEQPDPAAGRLAAAYAEAWTDPFLVQRYRRFQAWSVDERLAKLAADRLRLAGNDAYVSDGVEDALRLWRLSLEGVERLDDTVGIARTLGNIGAGHYGAGRLDSAAVYYERSRQLAFATGDFLTAANALNVLATLSRDAADLPRAGSLYLQALDMHERVGAVRAAGYDHHNLGLLALTLGDLDVARLELETAIDLSRQTGHMDDAADHLSSLADVLMAGGEYAEAEATLLRALTIDQEIRNRLGEAGVRHSLGLLAMTRGDYAGAVRELGEARDIYLEMDRAANTVSVQADLARARAATGDLQRGTDELSDARRRAESESLGASVRADLALASGDLDLALNEYELARQDYAEAERLYRRLSDYAGIAAAQHGQAFVHLYQADYDEAEIALLEALGSQQALGDPRAAALTRVLLADVYLEANDLERARSVASDARDVLAALPDPVGEAVSLATLAGIDSRDGLHREADDRYEEALALLSWTDVPDVSWRLHAGRARTLSARQRPAEALIEFEHAVADIERGAGGWARTRSGSGYLADKWEVYSDLAFLQTELGDVDAAFETSERLRAQRLLALQPGRRNPNRGCGPEFVELRASNSQEEIEACHWLLTGLAAVRDRIEWLWARALKEAVVAARR